MGERPELSALTSADGGVLRFGPFAVGGEQWFKFAEQTPGATLHRRRVWLDLLRTAQRVDSVEYLRRFYRLHLDTKQRLQVPPPPFRYFKLLHEVFSLSGALGAWIARLRDSDLAGLVTPQDGDAPYAKMNARSLDRPNGANHLMFVSAMDEFAGRVRHWDPGRVDIRKRGPRDFKKRPGATCTPLPCAYFPRAPRNLGSEVLSGRSHMLSRAWRRLRLWTTHVLGTVDYGFLV